MSVNRARPTGKLNGESWSSKMGHNENPEWVNSDVGPFHENMKKDVHTWTNADDEPWPNPTHPTGKPHWEGQGPP